MLKQQLNTVLQQLCTALYQISDEHYRYPAAQLEGNSIGAHTRHIIERYQELAIGPLPEDFGVAPSTMAHRMADR